MPKVAKFGLNLSRLCLEYCGLFFSGHGVHVGNGEWETVPKSYF